MRTGLPRRRARRGPGRRALLIAGVCAVLLHVLLAALVLLGGMWSEPRQAKKGEPLFVDIAPGKPQEKAPAGNPSRPPRAGEEGGPPLREYRPRKAAGKAPRGQPLAPPRRARPPAVAAAGPESR